MNPITAAFRESPLLESLKQNMLTDPYSYRLLSNFGNSSKEFYEIHPESPIVGVPHGRSLRFKLPKYGLLERAIIQSTLTTAGTTGAQDANTNDTNIGERIFQNISFNTSSKTICTNYPAYTRARIDGANAEMGHTLSQLTQNSGSLGANSSSPVVYTPLFFPFFEKTSNYLDLAFVDECTIECRVNEAAEMGLGSNLASIACKLFLVYRVMDNEEHRAYVASNFSKESPLNMLIYDVYQESETAITSGAAQTITKTLNCPNAIFATHFFVTGGITGATSGGVYRGPQVPVEWFSLSLTGKEVIRQLPTPVLRYDGAFYELNGDSCTFSGAIAKRNDSSITPSVCSIYWGESKDRTFNSHAIAMSKINNPQLSVRIPATTANAKLIVVHEYYKLLSVDPSDGRCDVGLSM